LRSAPNGPRGKTARGGYHAEIATAGGKRKEPITPEKFPDRKVDSANKIADAAGKYISEENRVRKKIRSRSGRARRIVGVKLQRKMLRGGR